MKLPSLKIDLSKIRENTRRITQKAASQGIEIVGVTKGCLGAPEVARAMIEGGIRILGDSRIPNLVRLQRIRESSIQNPESSIKLMMLRQPLKDELEEVVELADISLISEPEAAFNLSKAAVKANTSHQIILMVETGYLREGAMPDEVVEMVGEILRLEGIRLKGIGTTGPCSGKDGVSSLGSNFEILAHLSQEIERKFNFELETVSGGNSSSWKSLVQREIPSPVNQLRLGEAILLGRETLSYEPIPDLYQGAFKVKTEVIEVREKSFEVPHPPSADFRRIQVVVALGLQDIGSGKVSPKACRAKVVKISSDHLILDWNEEKRKIKVGERIEFLPDYFALLALLTSPFTSKEFLYQDQKTAKEFEVIEVG